MSICDIYLQMAFWDQFLLTPKYETVEIGLKPAYISEFRLRYVP